MKKIITLLITLATVASVNAAAVAITNHSFEGGGAPTPGNWNNNTPDGWESTGSVGLQSDAVNPAGIDGNVFGFLQGGTTGNLDGGTFSQSIATTIGGSVGLGDTFVLTLAALNQNASPSFDFDIRTAADPVLGFSLIGGPVQSGPVAGDWTDYIVFGTVDTVSTEVFLVLNTNGSQIRIDNVRLDYTAAVPEPSSTALLGLAGLVLIMRRRK